MQLKSLSISGFKSFAIDTKIEFAPGITSVVGPNGCGKSNVVDSLRWVLGEQRSSVLRGERMENVIFNGTNHRKPLNLAEVRVVVDNESGRINLPYGEIEIARRLHRDGTSEYLINGNACRLRDITDMLHDSGMGPNLYSILELKMVESILREDGEGRRQLFEEASGIAKYKLRRRQAMNKLAQTEDDLLRLADIIHEVERQVASLKRQVSRARRYKEYTGNLKAMESALMYQEYRRLRNELTPLEAAMQETTDSTESLKSSLRSEDAKLEELKRELVDAEQNASGFRKRLEEIVSQISTLEAEEAGHRATVQAARETIERTDRQRILSNEKRESLERRREDAIQRREGIEEELSEAERILTNAREVFEEASSTLEACESESNDHNNALRSLREAHANAESSRSADLARQASISGRRESAVHAIDSITRERTKITAELDTLAELQKKAALDERQANDELNTLRDRISKLQQEQHERAEELRTRQSEEHTILARLELLHTLEEQGPRSSSPLKALREAKLSGLIGLLADEINVDDKYRRALHGVLGSAAYTYLTKDADSADSAVNLLREQSAGRAALLPLDSISSETSSELELPDGALHAALELIPAEHRNAAIEHYLNRVVIVENWDAAQKLRTWARDNLCILVTLQGEWINQYGVMFAGSESSRKPVDLGLDKQRGELNNSLEAVRVDIADLIGAREKCEQDLARIGDEVRESQSQLEARRQASKQLREEEVRLNTLLDALAQRERDAESRISECDVQLEQLKDKLEITDAEIKDLKEQLKQQDERGAEIAERLNTARRELNAERDHLHQCERSRDAVQHQLVLLDAELERIAQALQDLSETQAANEQAAEKAVNDIVRLQERLKEIETELAERFQLRDDRSREVDQSAQLLDDVRGRIKQQEETIRRLRSGQEDAMAGERKLSMDVARLQGELEALLASARNQYSLDPSLPSFLEEHPELAEIETDREQVQELKQKIENLGPVNLMAVDEYEQENERLETMLKNREDLLQAKATLEETIRKINETAEAKFLHTFEAVRENFQSLFLEFFPAGEADLILSSKDLLEADVTIWANPSGKRLKSLSLMSGGEKTMTAIALLFSLYRVKPSPFCVLDEVDAPLDDTNIDRFTRMLRHHVDETQFILITHNKRTMEIADNLYGVTMQEEGVSKLVSVRLLEEEAQVEST